MHKPKAKDYQAESQYVTDAIEWACLQKKPDMLVTVTFDDGSTFEHTFPRVQKDVSFKRMHDKTETFEVAVDTARFDVDWLVPTGEDGTAYQSGVKRLFNAWVGDESIQSIKYTNVT